MPNIIYLPSAIAAIQTHHLHDVDNDTNSYVHDSLNAVASITGEPLSRVRDATRLVRHGSGWVHLPRSPIISALSDTEIEETMRVLGYIGEWHTIAGCPTLAAYLRNRTGIQESHPCIVFLTNHCVAISGDLFCGHANRGIMIDTGRAPDRRKLVNRVFVVIGRIFATPIPHKSSSRVPPTRATADDSRRRKELDRLFREAIKAETGATRVMITSSGDVHARTPSDSQWDWIGEISNVQRSLLEPHTGGYLSGDTPEAAAYRAAMDV